MIAFIRNPFALVAVFLTALDIACLNDSFAVSLSEKLTRTVRRFSPPLAHKLRAPVSTGTRGRPLKGTVYICGRDRRIFVGALGLGVWEKDLFDRIISQFSDWSKDTNVLIN